MRVLVAGYSPRTHTSYGTIIYELWSRLLKSGEFDVEQHAWFNISSLDRGVKVPWKLYTTKIGTVADGKRGFIKADQWGEQSFEEVLQATKPDIVWCLGDVYMSKYMDQYRPHYKFKLIRWTLTEGEPIDRSNIPYIQEADRTVAITHYAAEKWKEISGEDYDVIHHGVDTDVFRPVSLEERGNIREEVAADDLTNEDFLISYVGRNQARKRPWLPFEIVHYLRSGAWGWDANGNVQRLEWDPVARTHKHNNKNIVKWAPEVPAKLWLHSVDDGTRWRYDKLEQEWNISRDVIRTVGYSDRQGIATDQMAKIFQMSDVLSMLSGSEGFGVPIIEAAACGIPTVYTKYAGHGEIGKICKGKGVGYTGWEPAVISHVRWVYPDVNEAIEAFYEIHRDKEYWRRQGPALAALTAGKFSHDKIAADWLKILREVNEKDQVDTVGAKL